MNLDIKTDDVVYTRSCRMHLKIIYALKWPMTRLCTLNCLTDFDVVQLKPTIRYIQARLQIGLVC